MAGRDQRRPKQLEESNDDGSPSTFNWTYYDNIFANTKSFQDLWAYLRYLNSLGVTNIELASHGTAPTWMGGTQVPASQFDEYVETQLAVLEYALVRIPDPKPVFRYFSAFNEPEIQKPPEGIALNASEATTIVSKLVTRINAEKAAHPEFDSIKLIAPEAAYQSDTAPKAAFRTSLTGNSTVAPMLAAVAHHAYPPSAASDWNNLAIPEWMTETNSFTPGTICGQTNWAHGYDLARGTIDLLNAGIGAVMIWTEWDAPHSHDDDQWETFGLLQTDIAGFGMPCGKGARVPTQAQLDSATYTPKPTYHAFRQIIAPVQAGAVRIQLTKTDPDLKVAAVLNPNQTVAIIGVNNGGTKNVTVGFSGVPIAPQSLVVYTTTDSAQFVAGPPIKVEDGKNTTVSIPSNTIFAVVQPG